jgi:hypothetical protein
MAAKIRADRCHVLKRLRELRDWAAYIRDSVTRDQPYEEGKMDLLAADLGEGPTLVLRAEAVSLLDRLESAIEQMEVAASTPIPLESASA